MRHQTFSKRNASEGALFYPTRSSKGKKRLTLKNHRDMARIFWETGVFPSRQVPLFESRVQAGFPSPID